MSDQGNSMMTIQVNYSDQRILKVNDIQNNNEMQQQRLLTDKEHEKVDERSYEDQSASLNQTYQLHAFKPSEKSEIEE